MACGPCRILFWSVLQLPEEDRLVVELESTWTADFVTRASAATDLERGMTGLKAPLDASADLRRVVRNREPVFWVTDDYGMGRLRLCTLRHGEISWASGFPGDPSSS